MTKYKRYYRKVNVIYQLSLKYGSSQNVILLNIHIIHVKHGLDGS